MNNFNKVFPAVYLIENHGQEYDPINGPLGPMARAIHSYKFRTKNYPKDIDVHYVIRHLNRVLTVEVDDDMTGTAPDWMKLIETRVDIPARSFLGITAMTGEKYSDHHDVASMRFVNLRDQNEEVGKLANADKEFRDHFKDGVQKETNVVSQKIPADFRNLNRLLDQYYSGNEKLNDMIHVNFDEIARRIHVVNESFEKNVRETYRQAQKLATRLSSSKAARNRFPESFKTLRADIEDLLANTNDLVNYISGSGSGVENARNSYLKHVDEFKEKESSHSIFFWLYFIIFELLFFLMLFFAKKKRDAKRATRF